MSPDPVRRRRNTPRAGGAMANRGRAAGSPQLVGGDLHPCLQPVRGEQLPAVDQPAPASPHLCSPYARLADSAAASRSGIAGGAFGELSADPGRPVATGAAPSRPRESRHHLYLSRSYRDPRRYGGCGRRGAAGAVAGTAGRMSKRPRQGRPVAFATITPERPQPDPVLGLKFTIEARHGGTVPVDMTALDPRPLSIAFAGALRRSAALGGSIGAASVIKQYVQVYRHFFAWLADEGLKLAGVSDLRAVHIDGFASALERRGMGAIHRHMTVSKVINTLRAIEADRRSEEHTSELQSLMRISYAVFCLKKTKQTHQEYQHHTRC